MIDVMLEKIPGAVRSNKLQIIQLLEADLNQVLRIAFTRNIAKLAKNNKGIISDNKYGKSHATCMTPVLNKLLTVQLLIQKRTQGIVFDNDAKGCYDRIISGVALASLLRLVYSKESVKMLGLLWAQMEHHVCTGVGVSDKTYGSTTDKLLYGKGQGSCASPILWVLINQLLLAALGDKFTCIHVLAIDVVEEHIRPGDSFVDDTTTGSTNDDSGLEPLSTDEAELTTSEETIVAKMEEIIHFSLDLLQVTGGDLAPEKCVWYLISHRWKDGKPRLLQNHSSHRGIKIVSRSTNTESGVKRKAPNEGHRTLGFFITGDYTCSAQKKVMTEKASLYAYSAQFRLERGIWTYVQLILPALDRVRNSSDNSDSARMLKHPKASSKCHLAKNGDYQESSQKRRLWYSSIWRIMSVTPSSISRTYPFAIPNGSSPLQHHHWKADVLNAGLYTIGMWLYGKCTGTRLWKVFTGSHDRQLDYWNMGTSALVQINSEDNCEMKTATKSQERRRRDGSIDRY
jgi:hypothetical protein